jgi:putative acetyltransferase
MDARVRRARPDDAATAAALIHASFLRHVAPDWESHAAVAFLASVSADSLAPRIERAAFAGVAEIGADIVGFILIEKPDAMDMLFVAPDLVGSGIGRTLWDAARIRLEAAYPEARTIELNASPYAEPAYRAMGFHPISARFSHGGCVATRMAYRFGDCEPTEDG